MVIVRFQFGTKVFQFYEDYTMGEINKEGKVGGPKGEMAYTVGAHGCSVMQGFNMIPSFSR